MVYTEDVLKLHGISSLVLGQRGVGKNSGAYDACVCACHGVGVGEAAGIWEYSGALWFPADEDENQEQDDFPDWKEQM